MSELMKVDDVAARWNTKKHSVYAAVKSGELPVIVIGKNHFRLRAEDVERYEQSRQSPELVAAVSERNRKAGMLGQAELQKIREEEKRREGTAA